MCQVFWVFGKNATTLLLQNVSSVLEIEKLSSSPRLRLFVAFAKYVFIQVQNPTRFMEMPMKTRIALFYEYRIPISILPAMNFFAITKPLSNTGKPRFKGFFVFRK